MFENVKKNIRARILIRGAVQGVGFRPFIYRLAGSLNLTGWINNNTSGVVIEAEGDRESLSEFIQRIREEKPVRAIIDSLTTEYAECAGYRNFEIKKSDWSADKSAWILPDIGTCSECRDEIFDPSDRRYLYPFTNCTNCGPRYSIILSLPYDRPNTTMRNFTMCPECRREYNDPGNRRFHAQPNACPVCGPRIWLSDRSGQIIYEKNQALFETVDLLKQGRIIALKGIGGFQLLVDAGKDAAVKRLRRAKSRDEKPFAMMFPDMETVKYYCGVSAQEQNCLESPEAPIVLLKRKLSASSGIMDISELVAPDNPYWGIMLPYSPLHLILMSLYKKPLIATSGNFTDEPICINNDEAIRELHGIADYFLMHDRPIARYVDDSVVRTIADHITVLRRARGYAPLPVTIKQSLPPALAVGGHLKNTIAVANRNNIFISHHIGDLETNKAYNAFTRAVTDLKHMYNVVPQIVVCDKHPDYSSSQFAAKFKGKIIRVQHHYAHILSCMAENGVSPPVLGFAWDGTGYGDDGTVWGGECLAVNNKGYERAAFLRTFPLPGGDKAVREPGRAAFGLLYHILGDRIKDYRHLPSLQQFNSGEIRVLKQMLDKKINCPKTSSIGRLFDVVSSLLDVQHINTFEGQAAIKLENLAWRAEKETGAYQYGIINNNGRRIIDWEPLIMSILADITAGMVPEVIAATFHNTLADMIFKLAGEIGIKKIVLSGGTFQNKFLTEKVIAGLQKQNFIVYRHKNIPPNDGGISVGQILAINNMTNE
ncbi:carbamoyltransferase HypF [candidate division KSB1 bacterium]|nr:carbamoyltransferase HypF [candidate division KSB1 bacterium]